MILRRPVKILKTAAPFFLIYYFFLSVPNAFADSFVTPTNGIDDYTVQLVARVQESPPQISIVWPIGSNTVTSYQVYRKAESDTNWGNIIATLASSTTSYIDTNVATGTGYEYKIVKNNTGAANGGAGYGYIYSGIDMPFVNNRGTIIFVVDNSMSVALSSELATTTQDLIGDGWNVIRHDVSSTSAVTSVKALIIDDYQADSTNVKGVFLFGHIPVPYSGLIDPDVHGDHLGAWPADEYYGDMTGIWTDTTVNNTSASDPRNQNVPSDGKFDQNYSPGPLVLYVGRVDLHNMPSFSKNETELLRQYLNKDHSFRIGVNVPMQEGLITDNFGVYGGEAFAQSGWRNLSVLVGGNNIIATSTGYINEVASSSFLWTYGAGGGTYTSAGGVANTADFAASSTYGIFNMFFGSYFGDWDTQNNFLKTPLAAAGYGLTDVWSGRPMWEFDHMGLGETIGYDTLVSQNNSDSTYIAGYGAKDIHVALMGDPTLRQNIVTPPSYLLGTSTVGSNTVSLTWLASTDPSLIGYRLYRSTALSGPYSLATTTLFSNTAGSDRVASGSYWYMVRAEALTTTPSGSYYNGSEGAFATSSVTVSAPNTAPTIAVIPDQSEPINATSSIPFSVSDLESTAPQLVFSATTSRSSLVSADGISFSISTSTQSLLIRPINHQTGTTSVSVSVSDGQYTATSTFTLTINAVPDTTAPSIPANLSASVQSSSAISLSWVNSIDSGTATGDVSGLSGYIIYRNNSQIATTSSSNTSYIDSGLSSGTSYSYTVAAYDNAGNISSASISSTASTQNVVVSGIGGGGGGSVYTPPISVAATSTPGCPPRYTCIPSQPVPDLPAGTTNLSFGSTGVAVQTLQRFLIVHGYLPKGDDTGYFGPLTLAAISTYRSALAVETINTKKASITAGLTSGSHGPGVVALQQFLNTQGFIVAISGPGSPGYETDYFGPATAAAVKNFQEYYTATILAPQGMTHGTGSIGPATFAQIQVLLTTPLH